MTRPAPTTAAQRREAVARAFGEHGEGAARVARELGVAPSTVYRWAQKGDDQRDSSERLIAACQELAHSSSYDELTIEHVARTAGVAVRTAFNCFPTKKSLFGAAVQDAGVRMVTAMAREVSLPADPLAGLRDLLVSGLRAAQDQPSAYLLFADLGVPPADDQTSPWHEAMVAPCERLITAAIADGQLPPYEEPAVQARMLVAAARSLNAMVVTGTPPETVEPLMARLPLLLPPA
ncbi:TetR family transcriptional regulator [Amycolatopsis jiangsuensis]|uniref:AcrR family transcriptional regulator n=1 Tax=Amycolatopsis jiangsuensis TaxID=1181879 RepID=A0A840J0Q4_9PSEU|nr:TetR family transcriptional regulator [Amycolatopsis jiangsuensis]MBB4687215.1 AcrR family transcriptional regulator [Amycolatopsis jiangsuensis]